MRQCAEFDSPQGGIGFVASGSYHMGLTALTYPYALHPGFWEAHPAIYLLQLAQGRIGEEPSRARVPSTRFHRLFELLQIPDTLNPWHLHSAKEIPLILSSPLACNCHPLVSSLLDAVVCFSGKNMDAVRKSQEFSSSLLNADHREEAAPIMEKQGIVTILCSDCEKSTASSLRRTLSADMSSKKWLAQNGFFSPFKRISSPSDQELVSQSSNDSSSDGEEECRQEKDDRGVGKFSAFDVWGSILLKKNEDSAKISEPYIHPLVKRSASSLSEKSLEICTESLGSETGSDCFSSYPASEISDADEQKDHEHEQNLQQQVKESNSFEDFHVVKYKNSPPRPLPPPIPSIADGTSIRIQSHRRNGRLVLEAVSVPPRNNFYVQRFDGRLVLTLINSPISQEPRGETVEENKNQEFNKVFDDVEEIDQHIEEKINDGGYEEEEMVAEEAEEKRVKQNNVAKGVEFVMDPNSRSLPIGGTMRKLVRLGNKKPKWSNKNVNMKEVEDLLSPQSLPPRPGRVPRPIPSPPPPATTAATSLNSYQYFWRNKITPLKNSACLANGAKTYDQQNMVLIKGNVNDGYFLTLSRGCKKPRRSTLIWEPYCVATS